MIRPAPEHRSAERFDSHWTPERCTNASRDRSARLRMPSSARLISFFVFSKSKLNTANRATLFSVREATLTVALLAACVSVEQADRPARQRQGT